MHVETAEKLRSMIVRSLCILYTMTHDLVIVEKYKVGKLMPHWYKPLVTATKTKSTKFGFRSQQRLTAVGSKLSVPSYFSTIVHRERI
jgi:hypothetical protein